MLADDTTALCAAVAAAAEQEVTEAPCCRSYLLSLVELDLLYCSLYSSYAYLTTLAMWLQYTR